MPTVPTVAAREKARLERKKQIAAQQVTQFEDELSAHELNRARLLAIGESTVDTDAAIGAVKKAIEVTAKEA